MAVDMFLKIDGIKGESSDDKHKDEIQIESFSWGLAQARLARGGGGGQGRASFQDFSFVSRTNAASPLLALACATGEHLKVAILTARKVGDQQQDYLVIRLQDVLISSYQQTGDSGATQPVPTLGPPNDEADAAALAQPEKQPGEIVDSFSLNFSKIEYEYRPQKADGSLGAGIKMGWDLKKNQKV